jgi:hypothetical protein
MRLSVHDILRLETPMSSTTRSKSSFTVIFSQLRCPGKTLNTIRMHIAQSLENGIVLESPEHTDRELQSLISDNTWTRAIDLAATSARLLYCDKWERVKHKDCPLHGTVKIHTRATATTLSGGTVYTPRRFCRCKLLRMGRPLVPLAAFTLDATTSTSQNKAMTVKTMDWSLFCRSGMLVHPQVAHSATVLKLHQNRKTNTESIANLTTGELQAWFLFQERPSKWIATENSSWTGTWSSGNVTQTLLKHQLPRDHAFVSVFERGLEATLPSTGNAPPKRVDSVQVYIHPKTKRWCCNGIMARGTTACPYQTSLSPCNDPYIHRNNRASFWACIQNSGICVKFSCMKAECRGMYSTGKSLPCIWMDEVVASDALQALSNYK